MEMHVFIGGTSTAGKSFTANKFIEKSKQDIYLFKVDDLRKEFSKIPSLQKWVNIYWDKNELDYWKNVNYQQEIDIIVGQSEAFFPEIIKHFDELKKIHNNIIVEGVSLLPHLTRKYFDFPGFFMVNDDKEKFYKRLKEDPRWGETEQLQTMEAKYYIKYDVAYIKKEAKKYKYKVFNNEVDSERELERLFANL